MSKIVPRFESVLRLSTNVTVTDKVLENLCKTMINEDIAFVSVYFPQGTYTKMFQNVKSSLADKIASVGKCFLVLVSSQAQFYSL